MRCLAKQRDHDLGVKSERGWGGSSETQGTEQAGLGAGLWEGGGRGTGSVQARKENGSPGRGHVSHGWDRAAQCGRRTLAHCWGEPGGQTQAGSCSHGWRDEQETAAWNGILFIGGSWTVHRQLRVWPQKAMQRALFGSAETAGQPLASPSTAPLALVKDLKHRECWWATKHLRRTRPCTGSRSHRSAPTRGRPDEGQAMPAEPHTCCCRVGRGQPISLEVASGGPCRKARLRSQEARWQDVGCRRQRSVPAPACVQMAAHTGLMGRGGGADRGPLRDQGSA